MSNINITQEEISDKFGKLKIDKSPGTDFMHPRALYEVRDAIAYPSWVIFNDPLIPAIFHSTGKWQM